MTNTTKSLGFIDLHTDYDFDKYIAWAECVTFSRIERVHVRINILHKIIVYCCHDTAVGATNENMNAEKNFAVEFMWKLHHLSYRKKGKKNNKITENETIKWNRGDFELKVHFKPRLARTKIERWKLTVVRVCPFLVSSGQPTIQSAIFDRCWCWCMHETENVFVWKYKSPFIQMLFERHTLAGTNKINKIYEKIKKKNFEYFPWAMEFIHISVDFMMDVPIPHCFAFIHIYCCYNWATDAAICTWHVRCIAAVRICTNVTY